MNAVILGDCCCNRDCVCVKRAVNLEVFWFYERCPGVNISIISFAWIRLYLFIYNYLKLAVIWNPYGEKGRAFVK